MIRLVLVGLLLMAVYWLGRLVECNEWADGRIARRRGSPPCPYYCQARMGFQRISLQVLSRVGSSATAPAIGPRNLGHWS